MVPVRTVEATRYVTPLREGGSLPALVEADDDGLYVLKFRGAGQGPRALIAELIAGELARAAGLPVPEIVLMELDPVLGRAEADPEIKQLIEASAGVNLGLDYLPGSVAVDPLTARTLDPDLCARIVWFDALVTNVDRTPRNPNMLLWHGHPWLIDHGASLYFHHDWSRADPETPFSAIRQHVLLPRASSITDVASELTDRLTHAAVQHVVSMTPDDWLSDEGKPADAQKRYVEYLAARLASGAFAKEAELARQELL